ANLYSWHFLRLLRCFSSPGSPHRPYVLGPTIPQLSGGFPHSEIHGSTGARPSPRLIAACYVLPRLSVPRHPPNALKRLILANPKPAHRTSLESAKLAQLSSHYSFKATSQIPIRLRPLVQAAFRRPAQTSGTQDRLSADRSTPSPQ